MAKEHLEETVEITKKIGYADFKVEKNNVKEIKQKNIEKEREN